MATGRIVVIGSLNLDLVVEVDRLPRPGETALGRRHFSNPGGKGANQAVAAARLGGDVAMVGCVGADEPGRQLVDALAGDGVETSYVRRLEDSATGLAVITVDRRGENAIVVSSGANAAVAADDVDRAADVMDDAAICLMQLEIPDAPVLRGARRCGGTVVLNPAPARSLSNELLRHVDVLVPNQHELADLGGWTTPDDVDGVIGLVGRIGFDGVVIVTLGATGAVVVRDGAGEHVAAPQVDAVDTTAAGDAFCGALADALTRGADIVDATRWACGAGAVAATTFGAQTSLPTREQVAEVLS